MQLLKKRFHNLLVPERLLAGEGVNAQSYLIKSSSVS